VKQAGAAATEFVIVLVPMLAVVLGVLQLCQLAWAGLLVQYAAYAAARSAMVVLPEGDLAPERRPSADPPPPDGTPGMLGGIGVSLDAQRAAAHWRRSRRYAAIERAAVQVVAAIGPRLSDMGEARSVASALGGESAGAAGAIAGLPDRVANAALATATAIVDPLGIDRYLLSVPPRGEFVVRVTHLFACRMPVASHLLCRRFSDLPARARHEMEALRGRALAGRSAERFVALTAEVRGRSEGLP
jgi:hypothetical protein